MYKYIEIVETGTDKVVDRFDVSNDSNESIESLRQAIKSQTNTIDYYVTSRSYKEEHQTNFD